MKKILLIFSMLWIISPLAFNQSFPPGSGIKGRKQEYIL